MSRKSKVTKNLVKPDPTQKMIDSMELVKLPIDKLILWEDNPREHGTLDSLLRSFDTYGFTSPILAQRGTYRVLAGHRRLKAAREKGLKTLPVILLDFDEEQAASYTIADNAVADQSDWQTSKLFDILDSLKISAEFDLQIPGLDLIDVGYELPNFDDPTTTPGFKTESVATHELKVHPAEFRTHTPEELQHVIANIKAHGFYRAVIVARDKSILDGLEVVEAAKLMRLASVPVKVLNIKADHPDALKVLIGTREINHLTDINDRKLGELLLCIGQDDEGALIGTGYDLPAARALMLTMSGKDPKKNMNAAGEWAGMPDYDPSPGVPQLIINFRNTNDREEFVRRNELDVNKKSGTATCWWPAKEREDPSSVMWETSDAS